MLNLAKVYLSKLFLDIYLLVKGFILSFFAKKKPMNHEIDFVVLWVDGSDIQWRKTKETWEKRYQIYDGANGEERYRDWGLFHYWFRGVEKFAPWVRNVYLVTCGQVPAWLNVNHPKLRLVNHEEFIDPKYLPTFNSSAIEINLHHIKDLGEYFIYFNDDIFLTRPVKPEDFFQDGQPLTCAAGFPIRNDLSNKMWNHMQFTIMGLVTKFDWGKIIKHHPEKWFSYKYGKYLRHNWHMCIDSYMSGVYYVHFAAPFRKSTFEKTEKEFKDAFEETSASRFRSPNNITQQIFKIYDIIQGDYIPCSPFYYGRYYALSTHHGLLSEYITQQKYMMVCINDDKDVDNNNFEAIKNTFDRAFQSILPDKSEFEI